MKIPANSRNMEALSFVVVVVGTLLACGGGHGDSNYITTAWPHESATVVRLAAGATKLGCAASEGSTGAVAIVCDEETVMYLGDDKGTVSCRGKVTKDDPECQALGNKIWDAGAPAAADVPSTEAPAAAAP